MSALLCLAAGAVTAQLAAARFTLSWEHSIEHTEWRETWAIAADGLHPVEARVRGGGAGMEPPPDARLSEDGWWVYVPTIGTVPEINLPDSGYAKPMRLCLNDQTGADCRPLRAYLPGADPSRPVRLAPCDEKHPT